jgi:GNAT superfamily N-acetyltransferase
MLLGPQNAPIHEVYDLLSASGYPELPERGEALNMLQQSINMGWYDGSKLGVWVGLHGNKQEMAIDVAVHPDYRRKWAMKGLVRGVLGGLFKHGVEKAVIECRTEHVCKLAQKAGFQLKDVSERLHTRWFRLELDREAYLGKYW